MEERWIKFYLCFIAVLTFIPYGLLPHKTQLDKFTMKTNLNMQRADLPKKIQKLMEEPIHLLLSVDKEQ